MAAIYVDTPEQFAEARKRLEPVYITSKRHGKVPVPCCNTILVRTSMVAANLYNPNSVPPDRMELLRQSILDNGFCFPVVVIWDDDLERFVVIDGFHRTTIGGPEWLDFDYVPVVVLHHTMAQRMAATMQFNRARGMHQVDLDAEIVRALSEQGLDEETIGQKLGMDLDTVHRYKQITGVAALFRNTDYSRAWEMVDDEAEA